ncbi:MAG: LON peptidase substrate-binding domain-containing protein [Pigmentiphaga sp.]|uniref:LON peptidase substrate-binding domain-containing protein n=1 Tax=Pigmentiphaga sp. TaxID=1977564 RepID=UPI0029B9326D|nr:LON peptidase substrate-binding domain-containing protein [Pigmentiphaga sp.]MDX3904462.1 LON peptidase substrate-binding domain-containing protein [Pigmentiphaga sp.]
MNPIPLFPLSRALYPDGILHLRVFEIRYLDMIKQCIADQSEFGVVPLLAGSEVRTPEGKEILADFGTMAKIAAWEAPMPGLLQLRCVGGTRFRLVSSEQRKYGLWVGQVEPQADDPPVPIPDFLQPSANTLGQLIAELQQNSVPETDMAIAAPFRLDECGWVAYRWAELLPLLPPQQRHLLADGNPQSRLTQVQDILKRRKLLGD